MGMVRRLLRPALARSVHQCGPRRPALRRDPRHERRLLSLPRVVLPPLSQRRADGKTRDWLVVGLAMGLGFLCKYTAVCQIVCWAIFFALWPAARAHLRRPG